MELVTRIDVKNYHKSLKLSNSWELVSAWSLNDLLILDRFIKKDISSGFSTA